MLWCNQWHGFVMILGYSDYVLTMVKSKVKTYYWYVVVLASIGWSLIGVLYMI